jgi:hypothetical protein
MGKLSFLKMALECGLHPHIANAWMSSSGPAIGDLAVMGMVTKTNEPNGETWIEFHGPGKIWFDGALREAGFTYLWREREDMY